MRKPDFFIVGAPRCGTASMYAYLKQHPEVWVSILKEPHFFGSDLSPLPYAVRDEQLYLELFAGAAGRPRAGEASVWYLSSEKAPFEIRAFAPEARIIVMLREPAQMAHSLYSLYTRTGNEDLPTFGEALAAEPERRRGGRIPSGAYFPEGLLYTDAARYAAKVERYFAVFGRENVLAIVFDDFVCDTAGVYRRTLEFLGVEPRFEAELDPRRARERVRMLAVGQLRRASPEVKRRLQLEGMKQHESASGRPLPSELAARLRQLFAEDVSRLGALLGRDLGAWTRGEAVEPVCGAATMQPGAGVGEKPAPHGARLREVLESVRVLKKIPAEIRAKHERVETLERKFARWQKVRIPHLPLEQRPYNPVWADWFAAERARIAGALRRLEGPGGPGGPGAMIEHYGSTSVPGLPSKNIVDVAVGLDAACDRAAVDEALARIGYESYGNSPIDPETDWFWKLEGDRAFVVHLCDRRRPWLDDMVDLRDYLRAHPPERDRYSELKQRLAREKDQGFLQYTISKMTMWIDMIDKAKEWRQATDAAAGSNSCKET